ncbi:MAG: glycosyltransferase involved in cell wall biosynthesis [Kiritimatiellia bacterium]|jgi:glycosyltransferase involved in cell wall biosynthesis
MLDRRYQTPMKISYITAGAGGMYCGSCMNDNTLAGALIRKGVDVELLPTYTPIRIEQEDYSVDRVFFGGVNVFLQQKIPLFRHLPKWLDHLLDNPSFIRRVASGSLSVNAKELGELTISMLKGLDGYQRKEVTYLCRYLAEERNPEVVVFTNVIIAGCIPELRRRLKVPVWVTLQGDDIFLLDLVEPYKSDALKRVRAIAQEVDGFIVHTHYYAAFMQDLLHIPGEKIHVVPLGLDVRHLAAPMRERDEDTYTIGFLARLAPEKGLHILVDAFIRLARQPGAEIARLKIAGWLGEQHKAYAEEQFSKLREAGLADRFEYAGEVDWKGKQDFLEQLDVFSVPTVYHEPKGLFVLEAMAAGIPVVQPAHGAFPELIERGAGCLFEPDNANALADVLEGLLRDASRRKQVGLAGRTSVLEHMHANQMADDWLHVVAGASKCDRSLRANSGRD